MKYLLIFFFFSCNGHTEKLQKDAPISLTKVSETKALENSDIKFFKQVFKTATDFKFIKVDDPISETPTNTSIWEVKEGSKTLGFLRDIVTSTGCGGPCLPVIFTLFYDKNANFIELLSKKRLTKKNHAPFTLQDYIKLKEILMTNPEVFKQIAHPTEMVDALSGATLPIYQSNVVAQGAYTSLRVNSYNQHTMKFIKDFLKTKQL